MKRLGANTFSTSTTEMVTLTDPLGQTSSILHATLLSSRRQTCLDLSRSAITFSNSMSSSTTTTLSQAFTSRTLPSQDSMRAFW